MNKREKEVIQVMLAQEKQALRQLGRHYVSALATVNGQIAMLQAKEQTTSRLNRIAYQKQLKEQLEAVIAKLHAETYQTIEQFMNDSYTTGYVGTMYDLHKQGLPVITPIDRDAVVKAVMTDTKLKAGVYKELGLDMATLKRNISRELTRGIASGMAYDDISRNIKLMTGAPLNRAKAIVRTEGHRIQQASQEDARQAAKSKGADVVKQWDATLDSATRPTHRALDGQIREVDEPFEMHGKTAMYPGEFGDPAEDCNCRCVALTRARAALDADELKTMQERAAFFKLDKSKSFDDFKEKYLKASETLEKSTKSGIMEVEKSAVKNAIASGTVATKVNREKQNRHIMSSAGYQQGKSYIAGTLEDAQRLIDELSGKGEALYSRDGKWLHKERVHSAETIGTHVDPKTGKETKTGNGIIVYSKTGSHIIPAKGDEE